MISLIGCLNTKPLIMRITLTFLICSICCLGSVSAATTVDWVALTSAVTATGTHPDGGAVSATMTGNSTFEPSFVLNGSATRWSSPPYVPTIPTSDEVQLRFQDAGDQLIITFANPVQDPIVYLFSLQGDYDFGAPITETGGQGASYVVSGSSISTSGTSSFNGTVQYSGTFNQLTITANSFLGGSCTNSCSDGINMQFSASAPPTPVPTVAEWGLIFMGMSVLLIGGIAVRRLV